MECPAVGYPPDLALDSADVMVENCVGILGVPLGLGLHFVINNVEYAIPMAIEEPSVIAAASGAAKTIALGGGFNAVSSRNIIQSQVQLLDVTDSDIDAMIAKLMSRKDDLITNANAFCSNMVARGGGVVDVSIRKIARSRKIIDCSYWLVVHFHIDVCESMGANCATSVAEGSGPFLNEITGAKIGVCIVSNMSPAHTTLSEFKICVDHLSYKGLAGRDVAERIVQASEWAMDDPYRAVTNNKGIMNGIDSVALATGQDFRAIEAACHCMADADGSYRSFSKYWMDEVDGNTFLFGYLQLSIPTASVGG